MSRTIVQTIDLQNAPSEFVNKYITRIDENGIIIHPEVQTNSTSIQLDGSGLDIKNGIVSIAKYGDVARIGELSKTHVEIDYHSLQLIDKENNVYFHISDLRDRTGTTEVSFAFTCDGNSRGFSLPLRYVEGTIYTVIKNGSTDVTSDTYIGQTTVDTALVFNEAPRFGTNIVVTYLTDDSKTKAYTLGTRDSSGSIGPFSVVEGSNNIASNNFTHAEGYSTTAGESYSHAEGYGTTAKGSSSHAEGNRTIAEGHASHAEGWFTKANGSRSHAEGEYTKATGNDGSHAEGYYTEASGFEGSHAEGSRTIAEGQSSHAGGILTIASRKAQTTIGRYNIEDTYGGTSQDYGAYALIIGNGSSDSSRSNALSVDWGGNIITRDLEQTRNTIPASHVWRNKITFTDSEGSIIAYIRTPFLSNGNEGIQLETVRNINGTNKYNGVSFYLNSDGTASVALTQPAAWRTALGFDVTTYNYSKFTYSSGFTYYATSGASAPEAFKYGRVVMIKGAYKPTAAQSSTDQKIIGKVPSGCNPIAEYHVLSQGSGANKYLLSILTNGNIVAERYGTTTDTAIPNGVWLNISCTYISAS